MSAKKFPLTFLAVAIGVAVAAKLFWPAEQVEAKKPVQTVTTARVQKQNFPVLLEATGSTVAARVVDVRPQVTNVIARIHVKDGQRVQQGDLLFSLDDRADRANYDKAFAAAEDARRQYLRAQELVKQNFIAQSALDTAQSNAESAAAAARAAQAMLSYDSIRAPITGRIGIINVFEGALVQPGNTVSTSTTATATTTQGALATITQIDPIHVQFTIPEAMLAAFFEAQRRGDKLKVDFELGGRKRQGRIFVIDNQVDVAIGAVRAKAEVDNADHSLIPGQFVSLTATAGELRDALVVPSTAVVMSPRGEQIYVVGEDDTVTLKPVKVLMQSRGQAVVTGVAEGERVVVEGKQNLRPNGKVREASDKPAGKGGAKGGEGGSQGEGGKPAEGAPAKDASAAKPADAGAAGAAPAASAASQK